VPGSKPKPGSLTAKQAARFLSSLEPRLILERFREVCVGLLGPCEIQIFTFVESNLSLALSFGADALEADEKSLKPVPVEGDAPAELTRNTLDDGRERFRALLPAIEKDGGRIGFLDITLEQPLDETGIALLRQLADALAIAVGNAQAFERTRRLTFTDDLTALYNSRFMALYLDRELKRCRRTRSPLSVLFMDLDGFKNVNDTYGHLAGSRTLVEVGEVLEQTVRDADILIRYGGDEFVILFPETSLSGGLVIAERIRQVIEATKFLTSQNLEARISASIGIAAYPETADDVRGLISSADRAMYQAKTLGKDRVVVATPLTPTPTPS